MKRYPLGNYGLAIVLTALFLASWGAQAIFEVAIGDESWVHFWASTTENWQSEFLQLLTFVVLTKTFVFKGSHESKDSADDETSAKLDEILRRLDADE
jgi:hypothetical protein